MARELFPVFLDLHGRDVAVVGGGAVATERAAKLAAHGARVRLVSPDASPALAAMVADGRVAEHRARRYEQGDLNGAVLVVAATDDAQVNQRVRDDARALGAMANVADDPEGSSAVIPALMRSGDLATFRAATDKFAAAFTADRTTNLITRLQYNVIRTGLRRINLAYSRISLEVGFCEVQGLFWGW